MLLSAASSPPTLYAIASAHSVWRQRGISRPAKPVLALLVFGAECMPYYSQKTGTLWESTPTRPAMVGTSGFRLGLAGIRLDCDPDPGQARAADSQRSFAACGAIAWDRAGLVIFGYLLVGAARGDNARRPPRQRSVLQKLASIIPTEETYSAPSRPRCVNKPHLKGRHVLAPTLSARRARRALRPRA